MQRTVRIVHAPNSPGLEVVGNMVMKVDKPFSKDEVTVIFNPYLQDYRDRADVPGVEIRQVMFMRKTKDTVVAKFDFGALNEQTLGVSGAEYAVKLLAVGKERFDDQDFPAYEFLVSWDEPA